jgi:predicted RecB family endonuclease
MSRSGLGQQAEALRAEIGATRAELGETIQELAERVDVPARVRAAGARAARRARHSPVPWLVLAGSAVAVTALVVLVARSRRR